MWRSKHTGFARTILYKVLLFSLLLCGGGKELCAQFYPIHAVVQWPSPQSPHLVDYYSGSRDRLIITLHNRDLQQPLLLARLRLQIKSNGFLAQTREELSYPQLELMAGVPTRLTATDLMPYLRPESLIINGRLRNGQFPTGFTEISVQVVDYYSQQVLSSWHTARAYLDSKQPPMLNLPQRDEQVAYRDPLFIRFQWYPRHQGLAGTEYEFVLKELPDNGAAPQAAFAYGNEIYRTRTRHTTLNYTHLEPILLPNRRYAWQVQAIARDGVDELGLFEHGGFSEIYWFTLNENCPVPTGLKADPRYAKVDFSWNRVVGATGYMLACRPKTSKDIYEWSEVQSYGERMTLAQLKPGWTYEWRVGTLCTGDKPIYSAIQEVTLPKSNVDLLRDCGKEPPRPNLSPDPALDIQVGDTVTIGGDYPMVITQLQGLGDGWYSGRGTTRLSSIIELPRVALRFDRLRINIEKCQIDGLVEAIYADQPGGIADLDKIDDGGKRVQPSKLRIRERKVDFALGEMPEMSYDPETGELEVTDAEGKPQRIKLDLPEGGASASAFPMIITDSKGDSYQLSPDESSEVSSSGASSSTSSTEGRVGTKQGLKVERVERIGSFDASRLAHGIGPVRFEPSAQARYAFDSGTESWYQRSVKLDEYYKPFAKGYIAPWKLIPTGEQDIVAARYEGKKTIALSRVRFATSPNSPALPAELHEESKTWSLKLPGTDAQSSYDVYAIYEGQVIGKLRVVSYPKQRHKLTLVPVNDAKLDKEQIERELNSIYDSVGIHFDVEVDARMRGDYSWDRDGDGKLSVVGKSFFGRVREVKESAEMEYLKKAYTQLAGTLDGVYLFVVDAAGGLEAQPKDLLGEMPRRSRFGYIFSGNSPNGGVSALSHTIAHELGHGLFTLQHTFDDEYGGTESQGQTRNLMDYTTGKELAAFQWNVLANPAVFTAADKAEEGRISHHSTQIIKISRHISSVILSRKKPVLAPNGKRFLLPENAEIVGVVYNDYSSYHPACVGSVAVFSIQGRLYQITYSSEKNSSFLGYQAIDGGDTFVVEQAPSELAQVEIAFDRVHNKIIIDGVLYDIANEKLHLYPTNRVLLQTKTKPGFGLKSERDALEAEDAHGNGLTPPSEVVADDMQYGRNFDLSKIKDHSVRSNIERLIKESDQKLFTHVINLAEYVSRGELEDNNKRLIEEWRKQTYASSDKYYTDERLSKAVFESEAVTQLLKNIKTAVIRQLGKGENQLDRVDLRSEEPMLFRRPAFNLGADRGAGLTFALNDTWGFKVTLLEYQYDITKRAHKVILQLDIYDHFGLDVEDVEKYGSRNAISQVIKKMSGGIDVALLLGELTKFGSERDFKRDERIGISDAILNELADGFCSWFILQYMRGYKPFVTMMSKRIDFQWIK